MSGDVEAAFFPLAGQTNKARVRAGDDRVGDEGLGVSHDSVTEISTFVEVDADATHRGERECGEATWLCHSKKVTFFQKGNIFKTKMLPFVFHRTPEPRPQRP